MREIKFRAWDKKENKWLSKIGEWSETGINACISTDGRKGKLDLINDEFYQWVQFTGLKDKNGKEIYEGDIVIPESYEIETYPKEYIQDCIVKDMEWAFENKSIFKSYKVIGNIYENPELLSSN